jgi:hypothetical protein
VIGRIVEVRLRRSESFEARAVLILHAQVGPRRWKVEAYAAQNAVLMLSSINLPGGVQVSFHLSSKAASGLISLNLLRFDSAGNSSRMSYR